MKNLNPLAMLDSVLADWASARVRRLIHALLLVAMTAVTVWLGADRNWEAALVTLVGMLYVGSNHANTPAVSGNLEGVLHRD